MSSLPEACIWPKGSKWLFWSSVFTLESAPLISVAFIHHWSVSVWYSRKMSWASWALSVGSEKNDGPWIHSVFCNVCCVSGAHFSTGDIGVVTIATFSFGLRLHVGRICPDSVRPCFFFRLPERIVQLEDGRLCWEVLVVSVEALFEYFVDAAKVEVSSSSRSFKSYSHGVFRRSWNSFWLKQGSQTWLIRLHAVTSI